MIPALEVTGLRVSYAGVKAVHRIDLTVEPGEVVVILGANGAGKTSTLRGIAGLEKGGTAERIRLGGADLTRLSAAQRARAGLGHCLEDRHIFPGMSVEENLVLGQLCASRDRPAKKVSEIYEIFPELGERPKIQAGKLSGGQQQFLAIGRSLAGSPSVLMLDEPTNGLAPILIERVVEVIRGLRERGIGVLLVEQRLEVARELGDRVLLMQRGDIVGETVGSDPALAKLAEEAYLGAGHGHRSPTTTDTP